MTPDSFGNPYTRIELCVLTLVDGKPCVLLVKRQQRPDHGRWALPSGRLPTHEGLDMAAAANRVARDTLPAAGAFLQQQCVIGGPKRDDGHPWTLSVVYRAVVNHAMVTPIANIKAEDQRWTSVWDLHKTNDIATGYEAVIDAAAADLRRKVEELNIPLQLLPREFTITELQLVCEQILGADLDRVSFRRRVLDGKIVQETGNTKTGTAYRPAQLYRAAG